MCCMLSVHTPHPNAHTTAHTIVVAHVLSGSDGRMGPLGVMCEKLGLGLGEGWDALRLVSLAWGVLLFAPMLIL